MSDFAWPGGQGALPSFLNAPPPPAPPPPPPPPPAPVAAPAADVFTPAAYAYPYPAPYAPAPWPQQPMPQPVQQQPQPWPQQPVPQPVPQPWPQPAPQPPMGPPPAAIQQLMAQVQQLQQRMAELLAGVRPAPQPAPGPQPTPRPTPVPQPAPAPATPRPVGPRRPAPRHDDDRKPETERRPAPDRAPKPKPKPKPKPNPLDGKGPTMLVGAKGAAVKKLQRRLEALGFDVGAVDGAFGPKTKEALMRFQRSRGLHADGVVGPKTWKHLDIKVGDNFYYPGRKGCVMRQGKFIHASIARKFDAMVAAAKRDGISLRINEGHRTYAEQTVLWNRFGRNPARVAAPGTSMHESGLAIDFYNSPGAWAWLKRNASKFGLHNYPPEPWHYSTTGN